MIDDKDYQAVMAVSNEKFDKAAAEIRAERAAEEHVGPLGKFPLGKVGPDDKGELAIGLDVDLQGNVRLEFGTPVTWLAMPPEQAAGLGRLLIKMAGVALRAKGGPRAARSLATTRTEPVLNNSGGGGAPAARIVSDGAEQSDGEPAGEAGVDETRPARE